ncbi:MFS transporter [Klenkia soli]|uniref:MFS transporter n=1 Tax=Klenkia soli TaxID=1052260 RepID=UPI001A9604F8|nr:MFS transporter [Klenkia soli]
MAETPVGSPFASRGFRWFFTGRLVSLAGTSLSSVALAFAVLDAAGSATALGVVLTGHSLAMVVFLLAGGVVADRLPRRGVLVVSHLGAGLTQATVATVLLSGSFDLAAVTALSAVNGVVTGFTMPALRGIVPELVARGQLQRANSLLASTANATKVLGPTVAGVLSATAGGGWALAVDAVSYLLAALCLARVPVRPAAGAPRRSVVDDLRDGWDAFRSLTWVWAVTLAFLVVNLVQQGVWSVLGPTIARASFGEAAWGVILSGRAVGLLAASLLLYRVAVRRPLRAGQLCTALLALPLLLLGTAAPVGWLVAVACLAGAGSAVAGICWETALQGHVPQRVLSRVSSYDDLGSFVAIPLGQAVAGPLALAFGAGQVAVAGAVVLAGSALLPLAARSVRDLRHA